MTKCTPFYWAMRRTLRNEANLCILEGLLSTVLNEKISIRKIVVSEKHEEETYDKYNRVDLLAQDSKGEQVLIEVQNNTEYAYYERIIFGTSMQITDYVNGDDIYYNVKKIYCINIVYFNLGSGKDYLYHGKTEFRGVHENDILNLSPFKRQTFKVNTISELYPEYYILKVNDFNKVAKSPLEEWIYYLNTGEVTDDAKAPGLKEVRERLNMDKMTKDELNAYYRHLDNIVILRDNIFTAREEGRFEGREEGRAEVRAEERKNLIIKMLKKGVSEEQICQLLDISPTELKALIEVI